MVCQSIGLRHCTVRFRRYWFRSLRCSSSCFCSFPCCSRSSSSLVSWSVSLPTYFAYSGLFLSIAPMFCRIRAWSLEISSIFAASSASCRSVAAMAACLSAAVRTAFITSLESLPSLWYAMTVFMSKLITATSSYRVRSCETVNFLVFPASMGSVKRYRSCVCSVGLSVSTSSYPAAFGCSRMSVRPCWVSLSANS